MTKFAFVCDHVALQGHPILHAARSEPTEPEDSGWQFLCGHGGHSTNAQIWALHEVLALEPTLVEFVDLPYGRQVNRNTINDKWVISYFEDLE